MSWDGFRSHLLPGDVDEKFMKVSSVGKLCPTFLKTVIRLARFFSFIDRKCFFRVDDLLLKGSKFSLFFSAVERLLGSDSRIKLH